MRRLVHGDALMLLRAALLALVLFAGPALAANKFVRAGAGGSGSGDDWTNAYTALPASLTRGDTYYVADGSYSSYTFDDAADGTTLITVKKCTTTDGVSSGISGYSSAYCDGQAVFSGLGIRASYIVFDGVTRNESSPATASSYGFSVSGTVRYSRLDGAESSCIANVVTVKYTHVGTTTTAFATRLDGEGFYIAGFGGPSVACADWTLHRVLVQNVVVGIQCAGCLNLIVEYSYFYIGWGKEAIRGQLSAQGMTVRHTIFRDSCQKDPDDETSGCTGEIAAWGEVGTAYWDDIKVYGNVFYKTTSEVNSGGVIIIGGNGTTWLGSAANNARVYNNTIAGLGQMSGGLILVNGGSGNECRNNLWYDSVSQSATCGTTSNNVAAGSDPFVNYAGGDFRLSGATSAGYSLSSPYNVDMLGTTRGGDGNWDVGAYEYGSGSKLPGPNNPRWRPADAWPLWFAFWGR